MKLSVIIPCKKEAANIGACVTRVFKVFPAAEILVVDSGLDDTKDIIEQLKTDIPNLHYILCSPDRGKGDAVRVGIEHSQGKYIAQLDADLQFLPEELPLLLEPLLQNQADMVLGSRFMSHSVREAGSTPVVRSFGNFVISGLASLLFGQKISDALAGFKAWKKEVTEEFELQSYTFSYEVELFAKALLKGFRVKDVPVSFENRKYGVSTVSIFKAGFNIIKDMFIFRFCEKK